MPFRCATSVSNYLFYQRFQTESAPTTSTHTPSGLPASTHHKRAPRHGQRPVQQSSDQKPSKYAAILDRGRKGADPTPEQAAQADHTRRLAEAHLAAMRERLGLPSAKRVEPTPTPPPFNPLAELARERNMARKLTPAERAAWAATALRNSLHATQADASWPPAPIASSALPRRETPPRPPRSSRSSRPGRRAR